MYKGSIGNMLVIRDKEKVIGTYVFKNWVARFNMEEEIREYVKDNSDSWSSEDIVQIIHNSKTKCWGLDSWQEREDIEELRIVNNVVNCREV